MQLRRQYLLKMNIQWLLTYILEAKESKMAYDEHLIDRLSFLLDNKKVHYEAKKMFGGLCYMIDKKMCVCGMKDKLMARVGPEQYQEALVQEGAEEMKFTGRPLKGFIFVKGEGTDTDEQLEYWVDRCLEYNPLAKSSK